MSVMRLGRFEVLSSLLVVLLSTGTSVSGKTPGGLPLLQAVEAIENRYMKHESQAHAPLDLAVAIAPIVGKLTRDGSPPSGPQSVLALNRLIFEELAIESSSDLHDPDNLFVSHILERRRGYCVGVVALYLVLAERLELPIFAVGTPTHVFLRYDDGATRVNIETMDHGAPRDDAQYIREENIPESSIRRGVFMHELTVDEFIACFRSNLGVVLSERKEYARAAEQYRAAMDLDPSLPAAYYNFANDRLRQGELRGSIRLYSKSLRLYPTDVWALNNRGLAKLRLGRRKEAREDFEQALALDAGFEPARTNLSRLPATSPD